MSLEKKLCNMWIHVVGKCGEHLNHSPHQVQDRRDVIITSSLPVNISDNSPHQVRINLKQ